MLCRSVGPLFCHKTIVYEHGNFNPINLSSSKNHSNPNQVHLSQSVGIKRQFPTTVYDRKERADRAAEHVKARMTLVTEQEITREAIGRCSNHCFHSFRENSRQRYDSTFLPKKMGDAVVSVMNPSFLSERRELRVDDEQKY